jgi:hypothetical protein
MQAARISDDGLALDEQPVTTTATPFRKDDWTVRQRVRSMARELKRPTLTSTTASNQIPSDGRRLDPPLDLLADMELTPAPRLARDTSTPTANALPRSRRAEGSQIVAWLIVLAGTLALAAGIALIAWSLSSHQLTYWNLALGLALGGQGTLILGLVLVVSRLWRSSRFAAGKLQEVHTRLGQLQQTADALTAMRSGAPAFYAELVRGGSPHVLLANLKGQLDQLATRVGG